MTNWKQHIAPYNTTIKEALLLLDKLGRDAIVFAVNEKHELVGSLTDGDIRRGLIAGVQTDQQIRTILQPNPRFIRKSEQDLDKLIAFRNENLKIVPVLNTDNDEIIDVINFRITYSYIPADVVIMAGGEGKRLRPLTETTPKPLLKIGDKPIIEHNVDRLIRFGIKHFHISVNYLAEQIEAFFKDGSDKNVTISYLKETKPLGTVGSVLLAEKFEHDDIIIMNSDLLTTIDFEDFYTTFKRSGAMMAVAATSYHVDVPYAVLETNHEQEVKSLKEKPRYTYFSNAGIYILKKEVLKMIPQDSFFDITDLMEKIIEQKIKLITYPINGYWLDIGKYSDFEKAQEDIKHLKLD